MHPRVINEPQSRELCLYMFVPYMFPESCKVGCGKDVSQPEFREMEVVLEGLTGICTELSGHVAHTVSREELNSDPCSTFCGQWRTREASREGKGTQN